MADGERIEGLRTVSEARTADGDMVSFMSHPDDVKRIKEAIVLMSGIALPTTGRVVSHGGFGVYTRFQIFQHKYAGGQGGYVELLEISDPPDGRCGIVIHRYDASNGSDFFEYRSLEEALSAWDACWNSPKGFSLAEEQAGFLRRVRCTFWKPWFYAVGDQLIEGDLVAMDIDREDPRFPVGWKFLVWDAAEKRPEIKTCVGTTRRFDDEKQRCGICGKLGESVIVFFSDGTYWRSDASYYPDPIPLEDDRLWICEALDEFRRLLAGFSERFEIPFFDGSKFVGRFMPKSKGGRQPEGEYYAKIKLEGGRIQEGPFPFKPTKESPTAKEFLKAWFLENKSQRIEILELGRARKKPGSRKWPGVYPVPEGWPG